MVPVGKRHCCEKYSVAIVTHYLPLVIVTRYYPFVANPVKALHFAILPERDYVTFGSLLSQFRLSVVCLSVTLVHPTQGVEAFGSIS